jgi:LL-diaminopimelate aminotransferase
MRKSRLPEGGENLFQRIKQRCEEAEKNGKVLYRLSIGQPGGPALLSAREMAAAAVMQEAESMHEYQDNGSPGIPNFARRFAQAHSSVDLSNPKANIAFLPIPGIKPMLGLIPMACGGIGGKKISVATMTDPGYPTPAAQCEYLGMAHQALPTNPENEFLFSPKDIPEGAELLMLNYPHNPSGQAADFKWWRRLCSHCEKEEIRIFNDAAYSMLINFAESCPLSDAASNFPNLSWAEAFSASKAIGNGTGWRVGAMCGSSDFIGDIAVIKGNTDSGFFAPAASGAIYAVEKDRFEIEKRRRTYKRRMDFLINILNLFGMKIAVKPKAGFFTLWLAPKRAFGQEIKNAEEFNNLMIRETGIVGVPFGEYIRYAVVGPIDKWGGPLTEGFNKARVSY